VVEGGTVKGYLARLAASAVHPASGIRPVLSPVYASLRPEAAPVPRVWNESMVPMAEEPEAPRRSAHPDIAPARQVPNTRPDLPASSIERTIPLSSAVVAPQPELVDRIPYKPLVRSDAVLPANEHQMQRTFAIGAKGNSEAPARVESAPQAEPHTEQQTGPSHEVRNEKQIQVDLRPPVLATASARERRESLLSSHHDDIQIHIGRIEVTAMPSPGPPAIPRRDRKTPNLDDYLRRSR